jgi:hypothetical protein
MSNELGGVNRGEEFIHQPKLGLQGSLVLSYWSSSLKTSSQQKALWVDVCVIFLCVYLRVYVRMCEQNDEFRGLYVLGDLFQLVIENEAYNKQV